ncbi:CDP-glycerol glycerophosphotransferase family protein [Wielerella bovis]|uniref:CDP-glycerol glycerophosphotransferase family protein n=1 Tax=Wielerella bovis TaxID=2917790 RepID=UPI002019BD25|nr:CDP-glycerol glycerophosphotransferase family protein [Wielerella bovis]MCG7656585.1 CDP-glycerol glycerophosphotransferase family protein [Wielerella bovis]MCG7658810.1 CDP-glycerol glycerophosphotransferase family protein [Wielerella bovis]
MKLWLFGTYAWQGNPKALFLYMVKHCAQTHECWWVADNEIDAKNIRKLTGIQNVTFMNSSKSKELFVRADVYVTENFRENYPFEIKESTKIFNTWHGVGLKHIELALIGKGINLNYTWIDSIIRKNIKYSSIYRNQTIFLVTSEKMEEHFLADAPISSKHLVRGVYPRNIAYKDNTLNSFTLNDIFPKKEHKYTRITLFAPTHRFNLNGILNKLIPDFNALEKVASENNQLIIIKVHPSMKKDAYFGEMQGKYENNSHILFWDDQYDIYEIFQHIDVAIVDYSSIFYDMLEAGVNKFIRYVPDLTEYQKDLELIGDYIDLTEGTLIHDFTSLLNELQNTEIQEIDAERKQYLMNHFFSYETDSGSLKNMIQAVDDCILQPSQLKELHSFDIFDTLIRRSTLKPLSIFDYVRDRAKQSDIVFPTALLENWVNVRNKVEHDVRDMMRKTILERQSNKLEVTLDQIYARLQHNMNLSDEQIAFLKQAEIEAEIAHVEPIQKRIDFLFGLIAAGHDVVLASDMYLPENVIRAMLIQADERLADVPLYLSASIGYQKSTGKLYQHIFFDLNYAYSRWVHYGDNKHADGSVPRKYGIQTMVHDIDDFIPFEAALIEAMDNHNRYPAYQLATKMHRYRTHLIQQMGMSNAVLEQQYYAYAYVGSAFVPYINWAIKDALKRGYETLYFISRDGHFLKQIADKIIQIQGYDIQTKYIYGSRKVWRLPSFIDKVDDETFGGFGNFVGMDCFDDLVNASYLSEEELLTLFPEFGSLKNAKHLRGEIAENIRVKMKLSAVYHQKVLALAAEKRAIVRQYLQQEINPDEKFAFVEFWGRGYTQDTFGRLLNDAFGREINNPFYYVRSFTDDKGTSVRHNFVLTPQNFSFFEPIFAQTPYESISAYQENAGRIEPVIVPTDATNSEWLLSGILDFVSDYLSLTLNDADYFDAAVSQFTYHYQLTTHSDQFLCNIFSELKDNISSFGETKSYAPKLTLKQLQSISSKQDLDKLTLSIPMSLAKSDEKTINFYGKIQKSHKLPAINVTPVKMVYAVNPMDNYVVNDTVPFKVNSVKNNSFYLDVAFNDNTKRKDMYLKANHEIEVIAIDYLKNGVPRLLTAYGYITANKEWVSMLPESIQPKKMVQTSIEEEKLGLKQLDTGDTDEIVAIRKRKMNKLARNPYAFFKDSENSAVSSLGILFNEKTVIGRILTRLVRNLLT